MDPSAGSPAAPGAVTAALTYLVDTGEKPVNYPSVAGEDGVSRWEGRHEAHEVAIHDGRAAAVPFDLDALELVGGPAAGAGGGASPRAGGRGGWRGAPGRVCWGAAGPPGG